MKKESVVLSIRIEKKLLDIIRLKAEEDKAKAISLFGEED